MRITIAAGVVGAATLAAGLAMAQQVSPVKDESAAIACAPKDIAQAVACLDQHLNDKVKADMKSATVKTEPAEELYLGLWIRNNWGFWTGSDLVQFMVANKIPQVERASYRVVQAYWLKTQGCKYDWNNLGYTVAAMNKAEAGKDPCSVTLAEADTAMDRLVASNVRRPRLPAQQASNAKPDDSDDSDDQN